MTVNHGVLGSSPRGGAKALRQLTEGFLFFKTLGKLLISADKEKRSHDNDNPQEDSL